MLLRDRKHLWDILEAASFIQEITCEKDRQEYLENKTLRSAVERQFEIIGEALNRLRKDEASAITRLTGSRQIIQFRNLLSHGYDYINNNRVWDIVEQDLPVLLWEVKRLLEEEPDQ
ncbi:MAG: DUF86 domain-containing protein [Candidatus Hydrogenedentes bacterium]|nr:DUF86 domain-containing protein [Candidatus Hydrogenedentota bacterium]